MMSVMDEILPQAKTNMSQDELFDMFLSVFKYDIKDQQGFLGTRKSSVIILIMDSYNIERKCDPHINTSLVHRIIKSVMSLAVSIRRLFIVLDINPEYQLKMQKKLSIYGFTHRSKASFYFIFFKIPNNVSPTIPGLLCSKEILALTSLK